MAPRNVLVGASVIALLGGGCSSPPLETGDVTARSEDAAETANEVPGVAGDQMSEAERRELRRKLAGNAKKLEILESAPAEGQDAIRGEVPEDVVAALVADLVASREAEPASIEVLRAEAVTWSDGSLGCPEPGRDYTPAPVPGYRVILGHDGQQFDYRATEKGPFILCSRPSLAAPGAGPEPPVE